MRRVQAGNEEASRKPIGCWFLSAAVVEKMEHMCICACSCMQSKAARGSNVQSPIPQQLLAWLLRYVLSANQSTHYQNQRSSKHTINKPLTGHCCERQWRPQYHPDKHLASDEIFDGYDCDKWSTAERRQSSITKITHPSPLQMPTQAGRVLAGQLRPL